MRRLAALRRLDGRVVDALVAPAYGAIAVVEVLTSHHRHGPPLLNALAAAGYGAALLFRRRAPLPAGLGWGAIVVAQAAWLTSPTQLMMPLLGLLLLPYSLGAHAGRRASAVGAGAVVAVVVMVSSFESRPTLGDFLFPIPFVLAGWLAGRAVRSHSRLAAELHEEAVRAEEDREAEARRAMAEERRRIARELHDVVAHSVSVMVVQAGGGRRILASDPARATEAAAQIERTGREALVEMRRSLGLLHAADEQPDLTPQPSLAQVATLVERARAAGLPVELTQEGEPRPLGAGTDIAAYRVVQEGLTNALKHAGAVPTRVSLRWRDEDLEVAIQDEGGAAPEPGEPPGHGLLGMRERVHLYGGDLHAGRRSGGGFEVRARLPLREREAA